MPLDLHQLRMFHHLGRLGSYTRAGKHLRLSQSAVSHGVAKLERNLGRPLVEKGSRRFELTESGRYLQQVCARVFHELEEAEERLAGDRPTRVRFGAPVEFGTTVLIERMACLRESHPWLHLDFHLSNHLVQPLARDEVDLVLDCKPHPGRDLVIHRLFREKYVVIASPRLLADHPLESPEELEEVPVITPDRELEWWTNLLVALPREQRPHLSRVVVVTHVRGMINATLHGYGVGLVPKYTVLSELHRGTLVEVLPGLNLVEDEFCIYQKEQRAGREENRALTEFFLTMGTAELGDAIAPIQEGRGE